MSNKIVDEFKNIIGPDPVFHIRASISPLFMVFNWQDDKTKHPLHVICINKGRDSYIALNAKEYIDVAKDTFRQYYNGEVSLQELQNNYFTYERNTQLLYDELVDIDLKKLSNEELLSFVHKISVILKGLLNFTLYIENVDHEKISSVISVENKILLDKIWNKATEPIFISFEHRRLKKILDLVHVDNSAKKSKFIFTDYFWVKDEEEIETILKDTKENFYEKEKEYNRIKSISDEKVKEHTEWIKTLDKTSADMALFIQWVMHMRDIRKDPIAQFQAILADLSMEIMDRVGLEKKYAPYVIFYECLQGVEYISSIKENIKSRLAGCSFLAYPDYSFKSDSCDFGSTVDELENYIKGKIDHSGDLSGQVACKGKVSGTVRVVFDPQKDKGFKQGDILVTSMTRPEFLPLMKKAGAVVTNEGSITCHAAIVSRELNIPCIIGTKIATQVLKDGDIVEVDAEKGIVKILLK